MELIQVLGDTSQNYFVCFQLACLSHVVEYCVITLLLLFQVAVLFTVMQESFSQCSPLGLAGEVGWGWELSRHSLLLLFQESLLHMGLIQADL